MDELQITGTDPDPLSGLEVARDDRPVRRVSNRVLLAIGLSVAVARTWFSWGKEVFSLAPDEFASGGMTRFLSGRGHWTMFIADTWRPGLPTLLTPVVYLTEDPERFIRLSLLVGAALGGLGAVLLALLAERVTDLTTREIATVSVIVSCVPAAMSASAFLWAEPAVTAVFLAGTLTTMRFVDLGRARDAGVGVIVACGGYLFHGRLLPFGVVVTLILCLVSLRRRRWSLAAAVVALAVVVLASCHRYTAFVVDRIWESAGSQNTATGVLRRLGDPLEVLDAGLGQVWYLAVSTAGLFVVGAVVVVAASVGSGPAWLRRPDALVLLGVTSPLIATSVVFMSGRNLAAFHIYGRYNDAIVAPLLAVAVGWLVRDAARSAPRRFWWMSAGVIVVMIELSLLVNQLHGRQIADGTVTEMIAGLGPLTGPRGSLDVLPVAAVGVVLAAILLSVARRAPRAELVLLGVVALVTFTGVWHLRSNLPRRLSPSSSLAIAELQALPELQAYDDVVRVSLIPQRFDPDVPFTTQRTRAYFYQWYLPDERLALLYPGDVPPGTLIFGSLTDEFLLSTGAEPIWTDPNVDMALWQAP